MNNVLRTLVYNEQVSLTLLNATEIAKEGARRHGLSQTSASVFGRALAVMTYMSACLKNEKGEISLVLKGKGGCEEICISGNRALYLRGYIVNTQMTAENTQNALGEKATLTIIRDDGYRRPFVGSCEIPEHSDADGAFEEYYRVSEQLPTRIHTAVEFDKKGEITFVGAAVVQPLPFADDETLEMVARLDLQTLLNDVKTQGCENAARAHFEENSKVWETREAVYRCNCSREYLTRVLVSLGEEQLRDIIQEEGAVKVHCHYCNTDYAFTQEDADKLFPRQ